MARKKRPDKRTRQAQKRRAESMLSQDLSANYGPSCMAKLNEWRPGSKKWEHSTVGRSDTAQKKRGILQRKRLRMIDKAN